VGQRGHHGDSSNTWVWGPNQPPGLLAGTWEHHVSPVNARLVSITWLVTCLWLCKAPPAPCPARDSPVQPRPAPGWFFLLAFAPPCSPNRPQLLPPTVSGCPPPSTPFPGTGGSPGACCCWLGPGPGAGQPQHPTLVHRKTRPHPHPITAGTKAPRSRHPPGLRRAFPIRGPFPISGALCMGCFMVAQLLSMAGSGCALPSGAGSCWALLERALPCLSHSLASPCPQPAGTPGTPCMERAQGDLGTFVNLISDAMQNERELQRELMERGQEERGEVCPGDGAILAL